MVGGCSVCVAWVEDCFGKTSNLAFWSTADRLVARGFGWERISTAIFTLFFAMDWSSLLSDSLGRFLRPIFDSWRVRGELLFGSVALLDDLVLRVSVLLEDLVEIDAIDPDGIVAHGLVIEEMAILAHSIK